MKYLICALTILLISINNFAQNNNLLTKKYLETSEPLTSSKVINEYYNNFDGLLIDSLMLKNSNLLKKHYKEDFVIHELARVLHYKITKRLDTALILINKLNNNNLIQEDNKLKGSYNTLYGIICYDLNRPKIARQYYVKGLNAYSNLQDSSAIKGNLINIGSTYFLEENFDSAEYYFNKAKVLEDVGVFDFHQNLYNNLATIYQNTNRNEKAIFYYTKLIEEGGIENVTHHYNLGVTYYKNKQYNESEQYLQKAISLNSNESSIYPSKIYYSLSQTQIKLNKHSKAFTSLKTYDSLKNVEGKETANRLMDELTLKHKEKVFEEQNKLDKEKIERKKAENFYLMITLFLMLIIMSVLIMLFIITNKKNKILFEKNLELTKRYKIKKKSKDNITVSEELINKLEILLNNKEVYTNSKLTLDKLAKQLNTNRTYLSESINSHYKLSFSSLVNQYRINKSREMLSDRKYDVYSIEGVANTVGYSNISTFNSAFKKETGITPSYFRKKSAQTS